MGDGCCITVSQRPTTGKSVKRGRYFGSRQTLVNDGTAAASEFRRIIDHPGIGGLHVVGSIAHLGLARAYAIEGDTVKSRAAYRVFFALWKDADPDIPILKEAKAEYAKLK